MDINQLTKGELSGTGHFDQLMRAVTAHLDSQYTEGRITGTDYAQVYMGVMTSVLQNASQFLLASTRLDKELLLLDKQIENISANTLLLNAQKLKVDSDTAVSVKQLDVMTNQIAQMVAQTQLTTQQVNQVIKELELNTAQIAKITADTSLVTQQRQNAITQDALAVKQQEKIDAEVAVLAQRLLTEKAQTEGDENSVGGVLGKQMTLLNKQAEGFDRNAEQKLAKMMIDTWTVRQTTDGAETTLNGLQDSEINNVLNIAKAGIGASTFSG